MPVYQKLEEHTLGKQFLRAAAASEPRLAEAAGLARTTPPTTSKLHAGMGYKVRVFYLPSSGRN